MREKREIVAECLRGSTSADAILNALHQGGWQIRPKPDAVGGSIGVAVEVLNERKAVAWKDPDRALSPDTDFDADVYWSAFDGLGLDREACEQQATLITALLLSLIDDGVSLRAVLWTVVIDLFATGVIFERARA